ncbi:hypothetical protein ACFOYW_17825 [Gryllotalpicola reticulitermitis]|uniref:Uncharacterized protein n=1 Tax=Gryllotalpicola reticulitermitis TaxID=1184153 RepID=A0ABV8QCM4_9MICO
MFALNSVTVTVLSLVVTFVFIFIHLTPLVVVFGIVTLIAMWGIIAGFVMARRKQGREARAGYCSTMASADEIAPRVVQVDPYTGVVIREPGAAPIADNDKWVAARKLAVAWVAEQLAAGRTLALPQGWPDITKAPSRKVKSG